MGANVYTAVKNGVSVSGGLEEIAHYIGVSEPTLRKHARSHTDVNEYHVFISQENYHQYEYAVLREGEVMTKGTAEQIGRFMGICGTTVMAYASHGKEVDGVSYVRVPKDPSLINRKETKDPKGIDYIMLHFVEYGFPNVYMKENPEKYRDELERRGYATRYRTIRDSKNRKCGYVLEKCYL